MNKDSNERDLVDLMNKTHKDHVQEEKKEEEIKDWERNINPIATGSHVDGRYFATMRQIITMIVIAPIIGAVLSLVAHAFIVFMPSILLFLRNLLFISVKN